MKKQQVCYNIKKLRELRGYTQCYMAEELNITQGAYSLIENGISKLDVEKIEQIASILKVDINTLLNLENLFNNTDFKLL